MAILRRAYTGAGTQRLHRMGIGDITGTLEPGKCADMIVVEKNPLEDLRVLRNVDMVIVQGKVIRAPKVKKKQIVETELDKFLN